MKANSERRVVFTVRAARRFLIGSGIPIILLLTVFFAISRSTSPVASWTNEQVTSTPASTAQPTAPDPTAPTQEIVAAVNGVTLSASGFDQILAMDTALAALLGGEIPPPRAALERWINRTLLRQASPSTNIIDIGAQLTALLAQHNLSEDDLSRWLASADVDETIFRSYFQGLLHVHSSSSPRAAPDRSTERGLRAAALFAGDPAQHSRDDSAIRAASTPTPVIEQVTETITVADMAGAAITGTVAAAQLENPTP